jgi:hypothetical protein
VSPSLGSPFPSINDGQTRHFPGLGNFGGGMFCGLGILPHTGSFCSASDPPFVSCLKKLFLVEAASGHSPHPLIKADSSACACQGLGLSQKPE